MDLDGAPSSNYTSLLQDIRTRSAKRFYNRNKKGVFRVYKTARAGATTTLEIVSHLNGEKVVLLEPTNKIIDETVKADVEAILKDIPEIKQPKIVHVQPNHKCEFYIRDKIDAKAAAEAAKAAVEVALKAMNEAKEDQYDALKAEFEKLETELKELEAKCDALRNLKSVPRREECGEKCQYFETCEFIDILRNPDADIIALTYDKIANLMLVSENESDDTEDESEEPKEESVNHRIRDIILGARNFIADETHWLEFNKSTGVTVEIRELDALTKWWNKKKLRIAKYLPKIEKSAKYSEFLKTVRFIGQIYSSIEIKETVNRTAESAQADDYYNKHILNSVSKAPYKIISKDEEPKSSYPALVLENYNMVMSGDFRRFGLSVTDLNNIYALNEIANATLLHATATRDQNLIAVNLSDSKQIRIQMLADFFKTIQDFDDRRLILTTATFGTYNYNKLFHKGTVIKDVFFGRNGDPLNTTSKQAIFTHNKRFTSDESCYDRSIKGNLEEIVDILTTVLDEFGDDNCMFIAINIKSAVLIENALRKAGYNHQVTYYRSVETVGVKSNCRVIVAIGAAYTKKNAFDSITKNREESDYKALEAMIANVVQAMSRAKDPAGQIPSACLMLGVTYETAYSIFTQGINKRITFTPNGFDVTCDRELPRPKLYDWIDKAKTIRQMMKHLKIENPVEKSNSGTEAPVMLAEKKVAGNISKNKNIYWKQSNSTSHNLLSYNLISFLYYIYNRRQKVNHQNRFEQLDSRFIKKNPAGSPSASMKVAIGSEDSNLENVPISEDLDKFTCVISESQYIRHKIGKEPIKVEIVSTDNMANFILFDNIKTKGDLKRLFERLAHLKSVDCKPLITYDPKTETYGVWIFVEPINAKQAKRIARAVKERVEKKFRIKLDCQIYPKYTTYKSAITHGNDIILPLYSGAKILVNNQFVDDTSELSITIHDFSTLAEYIGKY